MNKEECEFCYGYGYWAWGNICPMGRMDAGDGMPTLRCPACGANPNPLKSKEAKELESKLEKAYNNWKSKEDDKDEDDY